MAHITEPCPARRELATRIVQGFLDERYQSLIPGFVNETVTGAIQRLPRADLPSVLGHVRRAERVTGTDGDGD
jgi:hypothetical protein